MSLLQRINFCSFVLLISFINANAYAEDGCGTGATKLLQGYAATRSGYQMEYHSPHPTPIHLPHSLAKEG